MSKPNLLTAISLLMLCFLQACSGGGDTLVVLEISGPSTIHENTIVEFSIDVEYEGSVTYQWVSDNPDAGELLDQDSSTVRFGAGDINEQSQVTLTVIVIPDYGTSEIRKKTVLVVPENLPLVGNISGPIVMNELESAEFSVEVNTDLSVTYLWEVIPYTVGQFDAPDSRSTDYFAPSVTEPVTVTIKVRVTVSGYEPVVRSKDVTILNVESQEEQDWWVVTWGSHYALEPAYANSRDITLRDNTLFMVGTCDQIIDADPGPDEWLIGHGNQSSSSYLVSYTTDGEFIEAWDWGGEDTDYASLLTIDGGGNLYISGGFYGDVDLDPGPGESVFGSDKWSSCYLIKTDPDANLIWADQWYTNGSNLNFTELLLDSSGNIYIIGSFIGLLDLDPGPATEIRDTDTYHWFVMKLNNSGDFEWVRTWDSGNEIYPSYTASTIDENGNIYLTGSLDLDPTEFETTGGYVDVDTKETLSDHSAFVGVYDPDGNFIKWTTWPSDISVWGNAIQIADDNSIYVGGTFYGNTDFDPGEGEEIRTRIGSNKGTYLMRLTPGFELMWVIEWGDNTTSSGLIKTDYTGNIHAQGTVSGPTDFDPGPGEFNISPDHGSARYIAVYNPNGDLVDLAKYGDFGESASGVGVVTNGMELDSMANRFVTGYITMLVDMDPGPGIYLVEPEGADDAFLLKIPTDGSGY